jgi:peptide-methionine (R)-S-oxide reductase
MKTLIIILCLPVLFMQCTFSQSSNSKKEQAMEKQKPENPVYSRNDSSKLALSDDEWRQILSPEVYQVARQKGTERPYSSHFDGYKEVGTYFCAACGNALFKSDTKFDSGCGWPSFMKPSAKAVLFIHRITVMV